MDHYIQTDLLIDGSGEQINDAVIEITDNQITKVGQSESFDLTGKEVYNARYRSIDRCFS